MIRERLRSGLDSVTSASSCPLCDSVESRYRTTERGYDIVECTTCSLLYVSPMPSNEVGKGVPADRYGGNRARLILDKRKAGRHCFVALAQSHPNFGYLVDVGCGFGVFLDMARRAGWTAIGLDLSPIAGRASQTNSDCPVVCASADRIPLAKGSIDAVTMWNVLEHLHDPMRSLSEIRQLLQAERGTLVVRVPNMNFHECLRRCRVLVEPLLRLMGKRMPPFLGGISPPEHLLGFTPKTLRCFWSGPGFGVFASSPVAREPTRGVRALVVTSCRS